MINDVRLLEVDGKYFLCQSILISSLFLLPWSLGGKSSAIIELDDHSSPHLTPFEEKRLF